MKKVLAILLMVIVAVSGMAQESVHVGSEPPKKKKKSNVDEAESLFDYTKQVISSNASFRFAIVANPEVDAKDTANFAFRQALKEIQFRTDIAFVIVLGNITADGSTASMEKAKEMLKKSEKQYYVLPGRKDIQMKNAGGTEFKRVFGDDCFRANVNGVFFLGLNTILPTGMNSGHFLPQKNTWLKNQLKNAGKKIPVYVFTTTTMNNWNVDNWYIITDMIRHYNIQLMIDNQTNAYTCSMSDGIPVRGVESLPQSYTLCTVDGDTLIMSRKELKGKATPIDTTKIEAKMYLEPDLNLRPTGSVVKDNEVWSFQSAGAVYTPVTASDKFCYFGDDNGTVYCLDLKKGKLKWKYQTAMRIVAQPLIVGNMVLIGSCDKNLYCLDATTGKFLWRVRTGRPVMGQPTVIGSRVYIDKNDSMLFSIDLNTGEEYRPLKKDAAARAISHENENNDANKSDENDLIMLINKNSKPSFESLNRMTSLNDKEYISSNIDGIITKFLIK